jgi:hypothetical protein
MENLYDQQGQQLKAGLSYRSFLFLSLLDGLIDVVN